MVPLVYAQPKIADQIAARLNSVKPGHWTVEKTPQGFRVSASATAGHAPDQIMALEPSVEVVQPMTTGTTPENLSASVNSGQVASASKPNDLSILAAKQVEPSLLPSPQVDEVVIALKLISNGGQYLTAKDTLGKKWILSKNTIIAWSLASNYNDIKIVVPKAYAKKKGLLT